MRVSTRPFANGYIRAMNITLPADQREWLEAEIAAGRFMSINDALAAAVAELMSIDADDLSWARPTSRRRARLWHAAPSLMGRSSSAVSKAVSTSCARDNAACHHR
jgi:Arc/MetJ-type ribon-helix-helix transcriptional regulator